MLTSHSVTWKVPAVLWTLELCSGGRHALHLEWYFRNAMGYFLMLSFVLLWGSSDGDSLSVDHLL
jgi:hypothetical protein